MTESQMITNNQDELTLEELFRETDQIQVPLFQREYIWTEKEFIQLIADIELVQSGKEKSQFLGAIVSYENKRGEKSFSRIKSMSIVDGQQRIITLYIFIIAIVESLAKIGKKEDAIDIVTQFLLIPPRRNLEVNTKIFPAFADRSQFRIILDKISTPETLQEKLINTKIYPPAPSGESFGALIKQYSRIYKFLQKENNDKKESIDGDYLLDILDIILRKLTFVHLVLSDASTANKIFERLNFRGKRVDTIDLVRNEIFTGLIDNNAEAKRVFNHIWHPFVEKFNTHEDAFFFPYCLIHNSNTAKSELFTRLREIWNSWDSEKIIKHMTSYQGPFMSIELTGIFPESQSISLRLDRLVRMNRPSAVYPYIMSMLYSFNNREISEKQITDLLDSLESFLVRRAILGFEPTGLHTLFKGLWKQLDDKSIQGFTSIIKEKPTIQWPTDTDLEEAIVGRALAKTKICNYLLVEYDKSLPGDNPSQTPTIEHILPQSYDSNSEWSRKFSREEHRKLKDTWANLIPLSNPINSSLQTSPYNIKSKKYEEESMFKTPRNIAKNYMNWTPEDINKRSQILYKWANKRWPHSV